MSVINILSYDKIRPLAQNAADHFCLSGRVPSSDNTVQVDAAEGSLKVSSAVSR